MAKVSSKNIAEAIYDASHDKSGDNLSTIVKRSAKMLKDKRMLNKSEEILTLLQNIIDKKTNTIRAKVTTSKKIDSNERKKIENEIKIKYKADSVVSEFFEKKELLGGMRVEVGDEVTDTTYKVRLQKLENFLIQSK